MNGTDRRGQQLLAEIPKHLEDLRIGFEYPILWDIDGENGIIGVGKNLVEAFLDLSKGVVGPSAFGRIVGYDEKTFDVAVTISVRKYPDMEPLLLVVYEPNRTLV